MNADEKKKKEKEYKIYLDLFKAILKVLFIQ